MTTALETTEKQPLETIIPQDISNFALEMAIGMGDFSKFTSADRLRFIGALCAGMRLNAMTLPFRIMDIDGRLILYATADCGAQLRARDKISIKIKEHRIENGCYVTVVTGSTSDGRTDEATGAVPLVYPSMKSEWVGGKKQWVPHPLAGKELQGLEWANAVKKSETQAKRRLALSLAGLGIPTEDDLEGLKKAEVVSVTSLAEPSAEERAANLNKLALTDSEKAAAIEVEKPVESPTAAVVAPSTQAENPAPAELLPASDGAAVGSAAPKNDAEKMTRELETLFGENRNCVAYCINQGKLQKGKGLETIDAEYGERILKNSAAFIRKVEAWEKAGAK